MPDQEPQTQATNSETRPDFGWLEGPGETITLSARDWDFFMDMLENPPPPGEALKKLMAEFGPWKDSAPFYTADPEPE